MDLTKPFASYAEVELHAQKLRIRSEIAALRFKTHVNALADKEVRSTLFHGALSNAVHGMDPVRQAAELVTSGGIASQLFMGVLTRKGGLKRRVFTSLLAVVLPNLLGKVPWSYALDKLSGALHKKHGLNGNSER